MKKYVICFTAALFSSVFMACNQSSDSSAPEETISTSEDIVHEAPETSPVAANGDVDATNAAQNIDFEPANSAESGQAYLAIVDGQWWVQYWGSAEKDGYMLAYNAGIADIQGDGSYTVSVTADTKGCRYDVTGDPDEPYTPEGLSFLSVMIPDGETLYPNAVITIDSIKVDGNELELSAKNYTCSDDGKETRANIYNTYVTAPATDARSPEGALYDAEGNALEICDEYSAQIVDPEAFATWTTVEVNFTITGTGNSAPAENSSEETAAPEA